jgi:hypothetical protein
MIVPGGGLAMRSTNGADCVKAQILASFGAAGF